MIGRLLTLAGDRLLRVRSPSMTILGKRPSLLWAITGDLRDCHDWSEHPRGTSIPECPPCPTCADRNKRIDRLIESLDLNFEDDVVDVDLIVEDIRNLK